MHSTDLFPTLIDIAGAPRHGRLPLDGRSLAAGLTDGGHGTDVPRFWQWSRYRPLLHANAAMRSGKWKLIRPAIAGIFDPSAADRAIDSDIKVHPERYPEPITDPLPPRAVPVAHDALLFDLEADPGESNDLASAFPAVVMRMEAELNAWFEAMELERGHLDVTSA